MYRHHPQWQWARKIVAEGTLGKVATIHSCFSFFDDDPSSILHHRQWGGGGLMDIGCYSVSLSRLLFGSEPTRVIGVFENDPSFDVDRLTSGLLEFPDGVATFTCSTRLAEYQRVDVIGTQGRLEIELPFNPPTDRPCCARLKVNDSVVQQRFDVCDHYGIQAALFTRAILDDTAVPTPIEDAVDNMRVIEALFRSGKTESWESL